MRCPFCGSAETKVIDSRFNEDSFSVKRRRECMSCGARFNTLETSELSYPRVIKQMTLVKFSMKLKSEGALTVHSKKEKLLQIK